MNKTLLILCVVICGLMDAAQAQSTNTNSLVRFRISYGTTRYGDIDVELFDKDKPVTVSNFLAYVQTRRYENTILNRCDPGFVLQGGEYTIANRFSTAPFGLITRVPSFGNITNEFDVGTPRSNVFGTLAMAKQDGNPNSANSTWFFNLADNSTNLDSQNGGFTVFGRVKSGANVLTAFNGLGENAGIANMTNSFYQFFCMPLHRTDDNAVIMFPELPVGFLGQGCPRYADLFTVQFIELRTPDVVGPKIAITTPAANASLTNEHVQVRGTLSDNVGIASVRVYLNTNTVFIPTGTNAWSVTVSNVPPGTNVVEVEATDPAGNSSRLSRSFFRSVRVPLTLQTNGAGKIIGATNGQLLELTRPFTLTARPDPGNLFAIWTGAVNQASATLKFNMASNMAFTAIFATNLFPYVKGIYNGLFYNTNQVEQRSSGFITLTLGDSGGYSGKLLLNGRTLRLSGSFSPDGGETNDVLLLGVLDFLRLRLAVDLNGNTDQILGDITNLRTTNLNWASTVMMDRAVPRTNWTGNYTFVMASDTNGLPSPAGESHGTLKIDTRGGASLRGVLADNTPLTLRTTVSKNGAVPLYLSLYRGLGALLSWVMVDTNQVDTDFSGLMTWFKQGQPLAKYYRSGLTNELLLLGSRYIAPTTNRVINLTNTSVGFTNGNLAVNFTNGVTWGADNRVVNTSSNTLSFRVQKPNGLFSGTVTPPGGGPARSFKGAVLQKQNRGAGLLVGTNETSQVSIP